MLKKNTRAKTMIALDMGKSVHTIEGWITNNDDNLTKAAALKIIREETGLTDEEILEQETESAGKV